MTRTTKRLVAGAAAVLLAVIGAAVPQTRASAVECMFAHLVTPTFAGSCPCPDPTTTAAADTASSVPPADDRINSAPTEWWTCSRATPDKLSSWLTNYNYRPTDLRVSATYPELTFSVTMVQNTGAYSSAYWWYYDVTMSQVSSLLSTNNARLISAVRYGDRYAVVMVPNTGANARVWNWCDTDYAGINACLGTKYRMTNIQSYAPGRFVVIFVDNAGGYGWCWYAGISQDALYNVCGGQSVLDISANADGTFNVVTAALNDGEGRVHVFASCTDLVQYARMSPPDRPLFVAPYTIDGVESGITAFRRNY